MKHLLLSVPLLLLAIPTAEAACPGGLPIPDRIDCLADELAETQADLAATQAYIAGLEAVVGDYLDYYQADLDKAESLLAYVEVDTDANSITFTGANVFVQSGAGNTFAAVNGLGNLIIGYDEQFGNDKSGSHNLVIGAYHTYSSYGGLVAGYYNAATGPYTALLGAAGVADGFGAAVSGGYYGTATGDYAAVSGGRENTASGYSASVTGGRDNIASGDYAAVSGDRYIESADEYGYAP